MKDHSGAKKSGLKMGLLAVIWGMIFPRICRAHASTIFNCPSSTDTASKTLF